MESNHQQELINQCEEFDDSLGVGRSYECVFCKRGFNTAQALGGHMNIHRREKVIKSKSTSTNYPNKQEEKENHHHHHQFSQIFSCYDQNMPASSSSFYNRDHFVYDHDDHRSKSTFPGSTSYFCDDPPHQYYYTNECYSQSEELLVHRDWNVVGLSLDYNSTIMDGLKKDRATMIMSQKEELDLELRLGL